MLWAHLVFLSNLRVNHFLKEPWFFYYLVVLKNQDLDARCVLDTEVVLLLGPVSRTMKYMCANQDP